MGSLTLKKTIVADHQHMRRITIIRLFFLLTWLFLLPTEGYGTEETTPFFRRYVINIRPTEYGGESQIWSIETDPRGFTYLAAGTGLIVYDGYLYDHYQIDGYSVIRNLHYDAATDRLYCAGDNFFGYWTRDARGEMLFTSLYTNRDLSRNEIFWRIIPKDNLLYLQTHEAVYTYASDRLELLSEGSIGYLFDCDDTLYVQQDRQLCQIEGKRMRSICQPINDRIVLLDRLADGTLAALGETSGFFRLRPDKTGGCLQEPLFDRTSSLLSRLKVFSACKRHSGGWIVGTVLDGAHLIDPDGTISESFDSQSGLDYTTILSLKEDLAGDLLLGADGGLARVRSTGKARFYYTLTRKIGYVYASTLWNGDLYLGTNKGLFRVSPVPTDYDPEMVSGTQGQIWDLQCCGNELLVIDDRGLYSLETDDTSRIILPRAWKLAAIPGRTDAFCASDNQGLVMMELDEEGHLRPLHRLKNYDNPDNSVLFDKYGYAWVEQLRGSVKRLSFDMDYTKVTSCRSYRVGRNPDTTIRAFRIDGEVLFIADKHCYTYSPHADTLILNRYYTDLFSAFNAADLNLYQQENVFYNYSGNTVDAIVRTGSDTRIYRDVFSSAGIDQLPQRFRRVFAWDDHSVACGFSESLGVVGLSNEGLDSVPKVILYRLSYTRNGKIFTVSPSLPDKLVLPHGVSDLEFRICSAPHVELDYRVDEGDWHQMPETGPLSMQYLASGSHRLEIRFGTETILAAPFFIKRHMIFQGWFLLLAVLVLFTLLYGVLQLYRMRMRKVREQFEARQQMLIEKEQVCHQNEMLSLELKERDKKLSMLALNDITINNMLKEILNELDMATDDENRKRLKPVRRCIEHYMRNNGTWESFEQYFNGIFDGFFDRLLARYPRLTNNDMKICAYVKLGMNTKEIATLMNIEISSAESARYRLRKNMGLSQSDSLSEIISKI